MSDAGAAKSDLGHLKTGPAKPAILHVHPLPVVPVRRFADAYQRRALAVYREQHINRLISMVLKAGGLEPRSWLGENISWLTWLGWRHKLDRLERESA